MREQRSREVISGMRLGDLRPGMEDVCLRVRVLSLSEPHEITTNYDATHTIVEGRVEDETSRMDLTVWNETIDQLKRVDPGDTVKLEGCFISSYKGDLAVNLGRDSKIETEKP